MFEEYTLAEVNQRIAKDKKDMRYYITLDKPDGTRELVYRLNCSEQEAKNVFLFVILEQQAKRNGIQPKPAWRVVRLFDKNDSQLAQES